MRINTSNRPIRGRNDRNLHPNAGISIVQVRHTRNVMNDAASQHDCVLQFHCYVYPTAGDSNTTSTSPALTAAPSLTPFPKALTVLPMFSSPASTRISVFIASNMTSVSSPVCITVPGVTLIFHIEADNEDTTVPEPSAMAAAAMLMMGKESIQ